MASLELRTFALLLALAAFSVQPAGAEPPDGSLGGGSRKCSGIMARTRALLKPPPHEDVTLPGNLWSPSSAASHGLAPQDHPLTPPLPEEATLPEHLWSQPQESSHGLAPPAYLYPHPSLELPPNLYAPVETHTDEHPKANPPAYRDLEAMKRTDEFLRRRDQRLNPNTKDAIVPAPRIRDVIVLDPAMGSVAPPSLWGRADALQSPAARDAHAWSLLDRFVLKIGKREAPESLQSPTLWTEKQFKELNGQVPEPAPLHKPPKLSPFWTEKQHEELLGQHPEPAPHPVPELPAHWNFLTPKPPLLEK